MKSDPDYVSDLKGKMASMLTSDACVGCLKSHPHPYAASYIPQSFIERPLC